MYRTTLYAIALLFTICTECYAWQMYPDGTYGPTGDSHLAPDGSYITGSDGSQIYPDGTYGPSGDYHIHPDGTYGPGSESYIRPDGTYGSTESYQMAPDGTYVDEY